MKLPKRPPNRADVLAALGARPERLLALLDAVRDPLASGKYLHWDKLRYYDPPPGFSHEEWWFGLKTRRNGQRIPLVDNAGNPFSFNSVASLQQYLHEIDLHCGGMIAVPEQVTNTETRNSYLVRSLIEEAFTSSQLEGAASTREIAKELVRKERPPRGPRESMILNNYMAMQKIIELQDVPLSKSLVLELHRVITEGTLENPSGAGRFRLPQEKIVVGDDSDAVFHVPPPAEDLERRMAAMCAFANGADDAGFVHPALKSMILHFWLAYDHPFVDGNGRTARALFYWSMLKHGYWLFEFVSISQAILKAPVQYGEAFLETETDGNDLTYFLLYHAKVVSKSIHELIDYIDRRSREIKALETELRGVAKLNYRQKELIRNALRHPGAYYTVESHRISHNITPKTSRTDLQELEIGGLLVSTKVGRAFRYLPTPDLERRLRK